MITLKNVSKFYYSKGVIASGFSKVNLELHLGEFVAITGESGSGKSTLLNVISGLDSYEEGEMYINGEETSHYTEIDFEKYRKKYISNIFQNFNLVNSYTVKQNIELVLLFNGESGKKVNKRVMDLIRKVGLLKYKNTKVAKLSGGQKQRVAIARALAKDTPIIIADEPTGNLDSKSAKEIFQLLHEISKDKLVVVVTHNYEQVESYVTRKIRMHDGRILEDRKVGSVSEVEYIEHNQYKGIRFFPKLVLGIRNAFNIVPKFLLVLLVYLFITIAVVTEYAFFRMQEYESKSSGSNFFFTGAKDTRLILKKDDGQVFSDTDYQKLMQLSHVSSVVKNDLLIDNSVYVTDEENIYFDGLVRDMASFSGDVIFGRLPESDFEIMLVGSSDNYLLSQFGKKLIDSSVSMVVGDSYSLEHRFQIVGIAYTDESFNNANRYLDGFIYGTNYMMDNIQFSINRQYSDLKVFFNRQYFSSNSYDINYQIIPTDRVASGEAYVTEDWNYSCSNYQCLGEFLKIYVKNIYYEDDISVKVSKLYHEKNMESLLGIKDFESYNGAIFINNDDFGKLFMHGNYQSSIYVDDVKNVDEVSEQLMLDGYRVLKLRDMMPVSEIIAVLTLFRAIVTVILVVTLFFISYFVIRIILKSRNVYFGTIRILGATKRDAKQLLEIELLTVSNLAFVIFLILLYLHFHQIITIGFAKTVIYYLSLKDYFLLYMIITCMSYFISVRFSRKIFKDSAMSTIREEV